MAGTSIPDVAERQTLSTGAGGGGGFGAANGVDTGERLLIGANPLSFDEWEAFLFCFVFFRSRSKDASGSRVAIRRQRPQVELVRLTEYLRLHASLQGCWEIFSRTGSGLARAWQMGAGGSFCRKVKRAEEAPWRARGSVEHEIGIERGRAHTCRAMEGRWRDVERREHDNSTGLPKFPIRAASDGHPGGVRKTKPRIGSGWAWILRRPYFFMHRLTIPLFRSLY